MGKLVNVFSWSHSAAGDFEECRRRRYYSKYAHWEGWSRSASPLQRTCYRLNKMTNRFGIQGQAAEDAVMWMLKQHQQGADTSVDQAFDQVAKGFLRQCWDESTTGVWRQIPKACCLHEHYYPDLHTDEGSDRDRIFQVADTVKTCIRNFKEHVLPRLAHVTPDMEIPIATVGQGDPEHFLLDGVKVYAIPDYVYVQNGHWHIIDWKSGKQKDEHMIQVGIYALWAHLKHNVAPENMTVSVEYLQHNARTEQAVDAAMLQDTVMHMRESVQDMQQFLVDNDLQKNQALPIDEWDMAYEPFLCHRCNFYELCKDELGE